MINTAQEYADTYTNPTRQTNPTNKSFAWTNYNTGEVFTCTDNTPNDNIWMGSAGSYIGPPRPPSNPTNTSEFIQRSPDDSVYEFTFTGAIGKDADIVSYIVENLSHVEATVNSAVVNVGQAHEFVFGTFVLDETIVTFTVFALDGNGLRSEGVNVSMTLISGPSVDTVDFLEDGSALALYRFEDNSLDTGGVYNGIPQGIIYIPGKINRAANSNITGAISIPPRFPAPAVGDAITISCWLRWGGVTSIAYGFRTTSLFFVGGNFGINTGSGAVLGTSDAGMRNTWTHVTVTFVHNVLSASKMYINGLPVTMVSSNGWTLPDTSLDIDQPFQLFGWTINVGYRNFGSLDQIRIFNRAITDAEALALAAEGT